ncbi:hypothetical protein TNCV_347231 [Trichonephila clavipes]|nr:hypothetical protein TNCV_347231 [Trichonephila clavipes]
MTKKETKPKEKPESPKLRDERHHSFPPEKNKEKEKIFFAGKSARNAIDPNCTVFYDMQKEHFVTNLYGTLSLIFLGVFGNCKFA